MLCACTAVFAGEPDVNELIRQLGDDSFKVREKATAALGERASELWDTLQQAHRKSSDPEARNRIAEALAAPTRRVLEKALAETMRQFETAETEQKEAELKTEKDIAAANQAEAAENETALKLEAEIARMAATPEREAAEKKLEAAKQAMDAAAQKVAKLKLAREQRQTACQLKFNRLLTRRDQLRQVIDRGDSLGRNPPAEWTPALLPYARRLQLPVSLVFVDTPMKDAYRQLSELSGIPFELATVAAHDTPITLRVNDLPLLTTAEWVGRLAELQIRREEDKLVVEPPKDGAGDE